MSLSLRNLDRRDDLAAIRDQALAVMVALDEGAA
jgi:hypothetical protein